MGTTDMPIGHGSRWRSVALVGAVAILAGSGLGAGPARAGAIDAPVGRAGTVARQSRFALADVRSSDPNAHPNAVRPFLTPRPAPRPAGRPADAPVLPSRIPAGSGPDAQPKLTKTGSVLEGLAAFEGTSFQSDLRHLAPPDTQIAAGPVYLAETVNDTLAVYARDGSLLKSSDLNSFFSVPAGYLFGDPRIVYDAVGGHWFLSGFASNSTFDSKVYIAVSASDDPRGQWATYLLTSNTGTVTDQPKIGVSDDKIVISWDDYTNSETVLAGQETWVLQKSDLIANTFLRFYQFFPDALRFAVVPSMSLTSTSTEYLAYNNGCSRTGGTGTGSCTLGTPSVGLVAITGTPATAVAWNELDPAIAATSTPPPAAQPGGPGIETNDDRFMSAVWQNGKLWTTANDACVAGSATQSCMRVIEVTTGASPAVLLDADLRQTGADLYYPGVTLDGAGNPYVVASISSATSSASVIVYGRSPTSGGFVGKRLWEGSGSYACSFCGSENRWGDYSGAAIDPADPDDVWVAGEHATADGGDNWGTAIGQVTFAAPRVTSVSPARDATAGGTEVTIHGANFTPNASVHFGAARSTVTEHDSGTTLVAVAPPGSAGTFDVTVTTPDGTSARSLADKFTFVKPPPPPHAPKPGYLMVGAAGTVYAFGGARALGNASTLDAVHIEPTPKPGGYWVVDASGRVFAFGRARRYGNAGALLAGEAVISLSATPTGKGYWLFTTRGRVLPFGDAFFYGDASRLALNGPIVGSVATPSGHGYYLVASDGGIFAYGDARFYGSMGNRHLNQPVNGLVTTADNRGYWLVASDGGIFAFGDAHFRGSVGDRRLNRPVIGMVRYGNGYLMVASDGGVFDFSDRPFAGSLGAHPPAFPIVGIAATR